MGYKLAGFDVIGNVEIDPKMNNIYNTNHKPKYNFLMDIRDFNKIPNEELSPELFDLDILDGSPPCTTFSIGNTKREDDWGVERKFKEGQKLQTLDDLSFVFIETVAKLKPKVVLMENVEGLTKGKAWAYVQRIYKELSAIGYKPKHWLVRGDKMGVPQKRSRFILIAHRNDLNYPELNLSFNYKRICFETIKDGVGFRVEKEDSECQRLLDLATNQDKTLCDVSMRVEGVYKLYTHALLTTGRVFPTIRAGNPDYYRLDEKTKVSPEDLINASTFPQDYIFENNKLGHVCYVVGMSVPPVMIKRIAKEIYQQWFKLEDSL